MRASVLPALAAGLLSLCLAACETAVPEAPAPEPAPAPAPAPEPKPPAPPPVREAPAPAPVPSELSRDLQRYYARVQQDLLDQGLLRGDGGGPDAPFTDTMLARDFVEIALFDEYADGTLGGERGATRLRRWEEPIRMDVEVGASVGATRAAELRAAVAAYAARLSRITGVPILQVAEGGNFHVAVLSEDERRAFGPALRALVPGISESSVRTVVNLPRSTNCLVFAFSGGEGGAYDGAVAVIRSELPSLMATNCIHEELAQGLGLPNDSRSARPTIFNDTDEFALLTRHDEMLLRILYDDRLRVGMDAAEAEPIVRRIATELVEGGSS